jgi:DNA-binding SARP family transcriptional activator/tetratricopeptide (TPR) repeat protein
VPGDAEYGLLGPLLVRRGGEVVTVAPGKQRVVLAALLLRGGRLTGVDELAEALWGTQPPPSARQSLHNYVARLRKALGAGGGAVIVTGPDGYQIDLGPGELDVDRFEAALAAGRAAARAADWAQAARVLREGLALWRGEPLAGIGSPVLAAREGPRLGELRWQATEALAEADLQLGRHAEVIAGLRRLTAEQPLRERLHGLLMTALYRDGQQAGALAAYQAARTALAAELGAEPGPDLRGLHQQILTADPALAGPAPAAPGEREVRYSLPPDTAAFTGRGEELGQVTAALAAAAGTGGVVAVSAIGGMPGAGKTALAVHAAHALAGRFPDRQLFIDLHGHTPGREPVTPEDALAGLLAATGTDPRFLPASLDGRVGMWRDKMAGQRVLLVLDNAAGSGQVAPLLPGTGGCLVLVTSRRHLGDLPGMVTPVLVGVLPPGQAAEMFIRLAPRAAGRPGEVAEVVALAGFLPLAISLLARLFARHPAWTLAGLAAETRNRRPALTAENASITAAFEVSYRYLDPARQRLFGLLGLHPGATTDAHAAAALAGTSVAEAAGLLDGLHGEGLLTETGHRRYGMHDLLRRYARDLAAAGPAKDGQQALERLLDYYTRAAARADARLARQTRPGPPPADPPGMPAIPDLDGDIQALAWARAERGSLLACLDQAAAAGQDARVVALTAGVAEVLRRDGPRAEAITRHAAAALAAQRAGDRLGQASALNQLGIVQRVSGDYPAAAQAQEQSLGIYRDLADQLGQANALNNLGIVRWLTGDYPAAAQAQEQSLGICRDLGDRLGQGNALNCLGVVRLLTADYPAATRVLEQALSICDDLGDRFGQANALTTLGIVRQLTGDYPAAARALEQSLGICRDLGNRSGEANALSDLGAVRRLTGDYPAAARAQEQALGIYRELGHRGGQANALGSLGAVQRLTGDYPAAAQAQEQSLAIYRDIGDRLGEANALSNLGAVRRLTGDYPAAGRAQEQALGIYRDLGNRGGEAEALNEIGTLHRVSGDVARAERSHQQALQLARAIASALDEASALAGLGRCASAAGHAPQAGVLLRQALEIFQRIGAAEAPDLAAELDARAG